jgi:hypothetical protein
MRTPARYNEWLRVRCIENPSENELRLFEKKARSNPRSSLIEFLLYIWMDTKTEYAGTRRWLGLQGLLDPSPADLSYFRSKIRRAVVWRASLLVLLVIGWFLFGQQD